MTYVQVAQGPAFVEELRMCQIVFRPDPANQKPGEERNVANRKSGPILGVSMISIV